MSGYESDKNHVLVLSGDPQILAETKMELMPYFKVSMSAACTSALNALESYFIEAIVICTGDNSESTFADFHDIFEIAKERHIPILVIAEKGNDDDETKAFAVGAVDYSARRRGTTEALVSRIRLRISASAHERLIKEGERLSPTPDEKNAEEALVGKTVLIVDDVMLNREVIKEMLSSIKGLIVEEAADGKEAYDLFKNNPEKFSLIFMDVQMPVMDGLESTKAIRALENEHSKKVVIIALTATTLESEIKQCLDVGMNDFLSKPMSFDNLIVSVTEHF